MLIAYNISPTKATPGLGRAGKVEEPGTFLQQREPGQNFFPQAGELSPRAVPAQKKTPALGGGIFGWVSNSRLPILRFLPWCPRYALPLESFHPLVVGSRER